MGLYPEYVPYLLSDCETTALPALPVLHCRRLLAAKTILGTGMLLTMPCRLGIGRTADIPGALPGGDTVSRDFWAHNRSRSHVSENIP